MNKTVRNLLAILFAAVLVCATAIVHVNASARRHLVTCNALSIEFGDSLRFLDEGDVKACLEKGCPVFIGQRIDSVDLRGIERCLSQHKALTGTEAWITDDGTLHVMVCQRAPVALFKNAGQSFYVDAGGVRFPVSGELADVPVIEGEVPPEGSGWMKQMLALLQYMEHGKRWNEAIGKISVLPGGELVMELREGSERFLFGKPEDVAAKFDRISRYYSTIAPSKEPGWYRSVNVKYKGQIVCRRK